MSEQPISPYLFAYGFLQRRFHGSPETQTPPMDVEFVSEGHYTGLIYQITTYPGVVFDPSANPPVTGEVFKMNDPETLLPILDTYENALPLCSDNPEYSRKLRKIHTKEGILDCWVYEYVRPIHPEWQILSGRF